MRRHLNQRCQLGAELLVNLSIQFQPHHREIIPFFQQSSDSPAEGFFIIIKLFIVKANIGVPGHAENAAFLYGIGSEQ